MRGRQTSVVQDDPALNKCELSFKVVRNICSGYIMGEAGRKLFFAGGAL
jgi:hypothetical protein